MSKPLPSQLQIRELPAPKYYEVIYTQRFQHEDGVRSWNERALIVIDEAKGHFSVESGYGNFAYSWSREGRGGESLHGFLFDTDFDYFMGKASAKPHRIPDHDRTVKALRRDLCERRREEGNWSGAWLTKKRAREMWEDLDSWEGGYRGDDLVRKLFEDSDWAKFLDYSDPSYDMVDPGLHRFWTELWRPFCHNVLRHWFEIDKQRRPARALERLQQEKRYPLPRRRSLCLVGAAA